MCRRYSRRQFLQTTGSAAMMAGLAPLAACGGGRDPMPPAEQRALTATEALAAMRAGRLLARDYVSTLIAQARRLAELNAFITLDEAGALRAAERIDAQRATGATMPPLAGLPIVVKDNIDTRDLPTTGGTPALRDARPRANAPVLQSLLDAGAIVLGKTNLHELAFGITSTNFSPFAGAVRNPYDTTRIPGGSSGGTAAAIAARIAPAGLGTDTGGSARVPAALTGIVGLRPSVGRSASERRYDGRGTIPISHTRDTIGPMGRSVEDVALLDAVLTGAAPVAPAALAGLRLGTPASFWAGLDSGVAAVMGTVRSRLAAAGVVLVDVDTTGLAALNAQVSFQLALHEPLIDYPVYLAEAGLTGVTLADIAAQVASPDVKGAFSAILADVYGPAYADALNVHRPAMQDLYAAYFADNGLDAMLFPTTILPAVAIDPVNGSGTVSIDGGPPMDEFGSYIRNTDPGSNAGIPGLALYAGMAGPLPVGLELDGPVGSDRRLLAIGLAIERLLGRAPAPALAG